MSDSAWRTVVVEKAADLRLEDGMMVWGAQDRQPIPVFEIRHLLVRSESATLSSGLINALADNNAVVVFCDKKHNPSALTVPVSDHAGTAGNVLSQAGWAEETKAEIWKNIIRQKIRNQASLLEMKGLEDVDALIAYSEFADARDADAAESTAARIYFRSLFGERFVRHSSGDVNSALNYGYVVVCSSFTRLLTLHGYCTSIGIHHRSSANRFNLSCDLMEPFRPFVDKLVFENDGVELDWDYKKRLLGVLSMAVGYKDRIYSFADAAEAFLLDVLGRMKGEKREIGEVRFAEQSGSYSVVV